MSDTAAFFPAAVVPREADGDLCEVCGKGGRARVCGCDGVDLICHLADCDTVCAKCEIRAEAQKAAASKDKPADREVEEPCILKVQAGCAARKSDAAGALEVYKLLGLAKHSKASFAADILFGHFENASLAAELPLGNKELDDFRHKSRCWTCWPPSPRMSSEWCIHPRELWEPLKKAPGALKLSELAAQIEALGAKKSDLIDAVPLLARELISRRLDELLLLAPRMK